MTLEALGIPWNELPLEFRRQWWQATDYGRHAPSPEFAAQCPELLAAEQAKRETAKDETRLAWVRFGKSGAFKAKLGNVTYLIGWTEYEGQVVDYTAMVYTRGPGPRGGGGKKLRLGFFNTMEEAKRACEQHATDGCDMSRAY